MVVHLLAPTWPVPPSTHTSLIHVKRIYNFLLIHACFVPLSHVFTINYHFYSFFRTNLLTRCQVPVPCFCCFCISEKSQQEISSDCPQNLRGIFMQNKTPPRRRAARGPPRGQRRPPAVGPPRGASGTRPCPLGTSSPPSDAYKIPLDLKPRGRPLFSRNSSPSRRHRKP